MQKQRLKAEGMNILVTGGAGYVGSHAVRMLLAAGHNTLVLDNLSRGHQGAVPPGMLVEGDLADSALVEQVLLEHSIQAVMHFAADSMVGESVADPAKYYQNNVVGSLALLESMRRAGVKNMVFSSSTATYGVPQKQPIDESTPQRPINPYGFSKLVIEQALADYCHAYGFSYVALRYFNAAGASPSGVIGEDHTPESRLIPLVLEVALDKRDTFTLFGTDYPTPDGTCIRDYVHVDDLSRAHVQALGQLRPGVGHCLNLGTGRGFSVREVIDACRRVTGHEIPVIEGERRPGDPPELVADATAAAEVLGWVPRYTDIEEIVATAWHWHRTHPQGYATQPQRVPS